MIRINNIKIKQDLDKDQLFNEIFKKYKIDSKTVITKRIVKKSIDARKKTDIFYNYSVEIECKNEEKIKGSQKIINEKNEIKVNVKRISNKRPVIIGAGPARIICSFNSSKE